MGKKANSKETKNTKYVVSCRVVLEMVEYDKMHVLSILIQCFRSKLPIAIQFWSFYNNRDYIG